MHSFTPRSRQAGMPFIGTVIMLVAIAFVALIGIKVFPVYMEHFKVKSSLTSLADDTKGKDSVLSPMEVKQLLMKRLIINDVKHVNRNDIKVTREGGKLVVDVSYEARVNLFYNIDLVARFSDDRAELGMP
ncbi:MAG: DUF4845 domain-containing protein [Gammaproteobacteria bacterium]